MIKTLEQLISENRPAGSFGVTYFNLPGGVVPEIEEGVSISGVLDCLEKIIIEKDVFTGHDVMILTGAHDPDQFGEDRKYSRRNRPIRIKQGAWLGSRSIILGGVTVGRNAVVGAGSVVTKDIPDEELWAGNPAKFIRKVGNNE